MKTRLLKKILNILQWILIGFSAVSIVFVFIESSQLNFHFTPKGFRSFLGLFHPYSLLYGSMFVVLSTNLVIERMNQYAETNKINFRIGNRTSWLQNVNRILDDMKDFNDPHMVRIFRRNLLNIHDFLFEIEFKINDKKQLENFFSRFVNEYVESFEDNNLKGKFMEGIYLDDNLSFSFSGYRYIFTSIVSISESYKSILKDLKELYLIEVRKIDTRTIDREEYRRRINDFHRKLRDGEI